MQNWGLRAEGDQSPLGVHWVVLSEPMAQPPGAICCWSLGNISLQSASKEEKNFMYIKCTKTMLSISDRAELVSFRFFPLSSTVSHR